MRFPRIFHGGFLALALAASLVLLTPAATAARRPRGGSGLSEEDARANEMLGKGLELLQTKQDDRGIKLISSIPALFPKSKIRFKAYLELGRYHEDKRNYDLAIKQYQQVGEVDDEAMAAEALYHTGICQFNLSDYDKAFMVLRKVTNDYPWTVYANEAFYYIGLCHFKLGRWSKAVEALQMVGTSVPANVEGVVYAEAGQRLYVKTYDKDLVVLKEAGRKLTVAVVAASGDRETDELQELGRGGEYFVGSLATEPGEPKAGDGVLQIIGGDTVTVSYLDENTESGQRNRQLLCKIRMVSTASIGFTDGAFREYTKGVFADNDCFVRVKDLDRDVSKERDHLTCKVFSRYTVKKERDVAKEGVELTETEETETKLRDLVTVELTETGPHTGLFTGMLKPRLETDATQTNQGDQILSVVAGDDLVLEYEDALHIRGDTARVVQAEAKLLVGAIQDVKIEHREVSSEDLRAQKQLIEAKIYLKLAMIFKDVGLDQSAYDKADEGLDRVDDVIRTSLRSSLDRSLVEEAFSVKWDLLLAKDRLSEAIQVCQALTQLFPDSTLVDRALLKIGIAKMGSDRPEEVTESVAIFNSLIQLRKSELKAEAAFHIGEVYEKWAAAQQQPDLSRAMLAYKTCAESYPESPFAGEALEKIANFYINNRDFLRAIELMEQVFQDYPDASFLDKMLLKWGIAAYRLKDLRGAVAKFDRLLEEYPQSPLAPKAREMRNHIAKKLGEAGEAEPGAKSDGKGEGGGESGD